MSFLRSISLVALLFFCCLHPARAHPKIDSLYNAAARYFSQGDYANNLKMLAMALRVAESSGTCTEQAYTMIKLGGAYYFLQDKKEFMNWMYKARAKGIACHDDTIISITSRQMGAIHGELGNIDSALYYLREAERTLRGKQRWRDESAVHAALAGIYINNLHDTPGAARYYRNTLLYARYSNDLGNVAYAHIHMGTYEQFIGNRAMALKHYDSSEQLYAMLKMPEGVMFALAKKSVVMSMVSPSALKVYEVMSQLKEMRDSIFREETAKKTAEYRTLYEAEKKQKEIFALAKDNAVKKLQIAEAVKNRRMLAVIFVAGVIVIVLCFLFIYNRNKQKQKELMERKIAEQQKLRFKAVLEAEEKERVRIARELHDSLGQMLSAAKMNMSAMDSLGEEDAKLMTNAKKLVDDSVREVRTISHNLMPASLMDKGIETALEELARKINDTGLLHIDLVISAGEERLDSSVEIAVYRIVQEVVNNMIKHSKANTVEIMLDYDAEKIYLSIKDNGVGFDTSTIEQSSGIGWRNIFSRVYMMNGDVQIDSQPGKGTLVNIELAK